MDLGTLLVLLALVLAVVSYFVDSRRSDILIVSLILIAVGVLVGADGLGDSVSR